MMSKKIFIAIITIFNTYLLAGPLLDQANDLYSRNKLTEAVTIYKRAAIAGENPALCYFNAANACYQLDSLPQAVVLYKACVAAAPDYAKGYLNLAVVYYALNDMANCIAVARRFCEIDKSDQKGRLILAYAYRAVGDFPGAVQVLEQLTAASPGFEEPYVALAEIYRDLEDDTEAEKWLLAYPASGKNLEYVYGLLAEINEKRGELPRALYYCQQSYSMDPAKKWTLFKIAALQEKQGNDLVAYETAREGMDQFPEFPEIAVLAGNLAFNRSRLEEAENCYAVALKLGSAAAVVGLENIRSMRERALARAKP